MNSFKCYQKIRLSSESIFYVLLPYSHVLVEDPYEFKVWEEHKDYLLERLEMNTKLRNFVILESSKVDRNDRDKMKQFVEEVKIILNSKFRGGTLMRRFPRMKAMMLDCSFTFQ